MNVLVNTKEALYFKLNELGLFNFNCYLLKREGIEVFELNDTVKEYIIYNENNSTLKEKTEEGSSNIKVNDTSYYNIGDTIRIVNFVAKITDKDSDENLYLDTPVDDIYDSDTNVLVVTYPDLLGSYYFTFEYNNVGNYNIVLSKKDKGIYIVKPIQFYVKENIPVCTDRLVAY